MYVFQIWKWYGDDSPLVDASIAHDSYRTHITIIDAAYDISMRKIYGLEKALCE